MEFEFKDFLDTVESGQKQFVESTHKFLTDKAYKTKIEQKVSGLSLSYLHPTTKKSLLNFFFRKKGLMVLIFANNHKRYADFLNQLSQSMKYNVEKAAPCKRLIDPNACNPRCALGYDFFMDGKQYKKCRFMCFNFLVDSENMPVLTKLIQEESTAREAF